MMSLFLGNKLKDLNYPRMSSSLSDDLRLAMSPGNTGQDNTTQSAYFSTNDLASDFIGFTNNSTADYSTERLHSGEDFDIGNGTNTAIMLPNEYIFDRSDVRAVFLVLYTIVFCSCFFGNLMVILVVTLHWRMRSITNFCLANLAFADFCVGIFCIYQNIVTYLMDSWVFGEFMCKMYHFINSLSTTASVLILVVICIERYLAIIHPMTCKQMLTLSRLRITIVLVWILSAAISSPRFYYFSTIRVPLPNDQYEILCLPNRTKYNSKLMDMISMTVLFLIPLTIIIILYTHIGIVLWKSSKNRMLGSSTPSVSVESSSSSCCYYRETDHNIIQTVKLTLLPVGVSNQHPLQQLNHHYHYRQQQQQQPSISTGNPHGINPLTLPPPLLQGISSSAQQPEKASSKFSSLFICFHCRNKSKKPPLHQSHKRSSKKLGRNKEMQQGNGTPSPVGSRACTNCHASNVTMNGNVPTTALMTATTAGGGGMGQEFIVNCKTCKYPYAHNLQQAYYHHPAGIIIPSSIYTDEPVQSTTTSFIQSCHGSRNDNNASCVTPASNSYSENWRHSTRSEVTSSTNSVGTIACCGSKVKRPKSICLRKQGSQEKSVTCCQRDNKKSPPSPFCNKNCSCFVDGKCSTTEPIVLVKFEGKIKQSSKKGSKKSNCTIFMNAKNRLESCGDNAAVSGAIGIERGKSRRGYSLDDYGGGVDAESGQKTLQTSPRFDCAICHPLGIECCRKSGVNENDNRVKGNAVGNETFYGMHHHQRVLRCNSLQEKFSFEHKRNLSVDSGISGMPTTTTGQTNIEEGPCDQNFDGHYLPTTAIRACGALCPSCGTSCGDSHQLFRCHNNHHRGNFVSSSCDSGSRKLSQFVSSDGGGGTVLPGVSVASSLAPKRIRKMRIVRSSKYGTGALLSRRRIIRMLIVVVLAFALCHLPFHARKVWQYWSPKWAPYQAGSVFSTLFTPITFLIMYSNSAINPILYAFMSKKFRMSFRDLLCCRMRHSLRISRNASVKSTHAVAL